MRSIRMGCCLTIVLGAICALAQKTDLQWDWRSQEVIGRNDPSLGNTSRISDAQRAELQDAIVTRLQKPMTDAGYDADRIREIASTTRLRFIDLGEDKPVIIATSLGLEGGCDVLANCPLWIFRQAKKNYVMLLDVIAASYTIQPTSTNGFFDLVVLKHLSAEESKLTLYKYSDSKYTDAGCYLATWPATKASGNQDPEIKPCKE